MNVNPGKEFRSLLKSEKYVYTTGVYSPLQAKLAALAGLKSVYVSGYSCSLGYLGKADLGWLTMNEMTTITKYVARAVSIPVIVDADDGYGNPIIVTRTVEEFESAGAAGIQIEDQKAPKRCGHLAGKTVLPIDEAVNKIRAALRARRNQDFLIIARTDARGATGGSLAEAVKRGLAFASAGADMLFCEFTSPDAVDEFKTFADSVHKEHPNLPLMYNYSSSFNWHKSSNKLTFEQLSELGYKFMIVSMGAAHAEMFGVWNFVASLKAKEQIAQFDLEKMTEGHYTEDHHKIGDFDQFRKLEEEFLPVDSVKDKYAHSEGYAGSAK